ncbi:uncharacterized protein LOC134290986 [Aedes albopictus]|uniref:Reverse transcriptase domain-containing protein n=1 Tax=Aedes albopictus TaxID=7160 RepID=A0ABM1YYL5_AEDAL
MLQRLFAKYSNVFDDSIGRISSVQANLRLTPNAKPVFLKARKIPFIKKSENRMRICGDYKQTVNPLLIGIRCQPWMNSRGGTGGPRNTDSQYTSGIIPPKSPDVRGVIGSSDMAETNRDQDFPGVSVFLDDIKVTGPNDEVHLRRLEEVLRRLSYYGFRVNKEKCVFFADKIEYCGYDIDRDGVHKVAKNVEVIQEMRRPKTKDEVRSIVGMINYYGRFFET